MYQLATLRGVFLKDYDLENEIWQLIASKREDDYWDFKENHHANTANLLHDIICMANNRVDRDAYIIYGIADKTYEVSGIENDPNRRNQQNVIDQLKSKKFVSGIRPRIEMRTLGFYPHEVDVLIIKNSTDTPYFLTEDYRDSGRTVRAYHIYTRVGDTNTDIDKSADINNVEYLWKKRFLLTRSPFEQILKRLENKEEWRKQEQTYFNIYNPEFTISIEDDDEDLTPEFYSYAVMNESTLFRILNINYYGTRLYSTQLVVLDSGRYPTPVPEWGFLTFGEYKSHPDYGFKYFIENQPDYKLNIFLYDEEDGEEEYARQSLFEVILLFRDSNEKDTFISYVYAHKDDFDKKLKSFEGDYSWIETSNKRKDEQIAVRLRAGKALNLMLKEFVANNGNYTGF